MKIDRITMTVKRTQVMNVVVSSENGYVMPNTGNMLLDVCQEMKDRPELYYAGQAWEDEEVETLAFDIEEAEL